MLTANTLKQSLDVIKVHKAHSIFCRSFFDGLKQIVNEITGKEIKNRDKEDIVIIINEGADVFNNLGPCEQKPWTETEKQTNTFFFNYKIRNLGLSVGLIGFSFLLFFLLAFKLDFKLLRQNLN